MKTITFEIKEEEIELIFKKAEEAGLPKQKVIECLYLEVLALMGSFCYEEEASEEFINQVKTYIKFTQDEQ